MRFKWKRQSANTQHVQCITIKHYNFDRNQQCHKLWPAWAAFISIIPLSSFSSTLTRTHESMWQFGVAFVFSNAYHLFVLQQNVSSQPFFHNNILLETKHTCTGSEEDCTVTELSVLLPYADIMLTQECTYVAYHFNLNTCRYLLLHWRSKQTV